MSSRAQASVSKKLLQVADKIESDAPCPRAIANTLRYECIVTCIGSLLARTPATYQAADERPAIGERRREARRIRRALLLILG
jgi:hypothetical protein